MSFGEYQDILASFKNLRVRPETLESFGFQRKNNTGWLYTEDLPEITLRCCISISIHGEMQEKVLDRKTKEEYDQYRVPAAEGIFVGKVRTAVTELLKRLATTCFERDVFRLEQSRALVEASRNTWGEELEFLWEDTPQYAIIRRKNSQKWYAVMMRLPRSKFNLPDKSVSEFVLLRIPKGDEETIRQDTRFLPAFHMNKKTWFAIQLDGTLPFPEIQRLLEFSRDLAQAK